MTEARVLLFSATLVMCISFAWAGEAGAAGTEHPPVERYTYRAVPLDGNEAESRGEAVEIEIMEEADRVHYASRVVSDEGGEETTIAMDRSGSFLSGTRTLLNDRGKVLRKDRLARSGSRMIHETAAAVRGRTEEVDLPEDKMVAVGGSLLVLLRAFPFDSDETWRVFMVDFSGASITVSVHQAGRETLDTPAGRLECYRIEVTVNIPLFRPKITYWLARERPHHLVKSVGKRGPFTASYETTLQSKGR